MTAAEKPVYLLALRDEWECIAIGPSMIIAMAFGTEDEARRYLSEFLAEKRGIPQAAWRIVEYQFTGNVAEG